MFDDFYICTIYTPYTPCSHDLRKRCIDHSKPVRPWTIPWTPIGHCPPGQRCTQEFSKGFRLEENTSDELRKVKAGSCGASKASF